MILTLTLTIDSDSDSDSDYRLRLSTPTNGKSLRGEKPLSVVRCLLSLKFFNKSFYHIVCAIVDVF